MFVNDIYEVARALSARKPGGRHVPAISFVLDEAANIAPLPNLGSMFSEGAGRGLFMCAIFQDVHQMEARWGAIQAKTIFQQARLTYIMGSSKDPEWNEQIAALSREFEAQRSSVSTSNQGRSVSTHTEHRHALRASDIQNIAVGHAVLLAPGHEATMIDLPDIAEDRDWGPLVKEGTVMYNERLRAGVDDDEWMTVPC
jgi:conjugal transfer protein traD